MPALPACRLLIVTALVVVLAGCVRSKVVITSEPEGATVTMNGVSVGTTPTERPFTWYWYYDFVARKEGYTTLRERHRFRAPIYLWPGLDLLMEAMPFYVDDTKHVHLVLQELDARPEPRYAGN